MFSNIELATIALYLLGGDARAQDTEDIAIRLRELDEKRFSWRKYPDQVNLELVRVALSDAKKPDNGGYVAGSGSEGWLLTTLGFQFAKNAAIADFGPRQRLPHPRDRNWQNRERVRMISTSAYERFRAGTLESVTPQMAASFFHLDDYVRGDAREKKVSRLLVAFSDDPELGDAVKAIARRLACA